MARSGVEDIDGISSMTGLKELYLAYNEITDISPISMVENLQILDLEGVGRSYFLDNSITRFIVLLVTKSPCLL